MVNPPLKPYSFGNHLRQKHRQHAGLQLFKYLGATLVLIQAVNAQPAQIVTPITAMAHEIYKISHHDIKWNTHDYRIYIATPKQAPQYDRKPVALYMLDGNAQFPLAVNAAQTQWEQLMAKPARSAQLPVIIGLGYPDTTAYPKEARTRDYTYAAPGEQFADGGGAADFYQFISTQVRPYVETQQATDPERQILAGHSFGGLFTLFVLLNHPDAFNRYVIGSPSLWWGNGAIVKEAKMPAAPAMETVNKISSKPTLSSNEKPNRLVSSVSILQGEYEENPKADPNITQERLARIQARSGTSEITARQLTAWLKSHDINSQFTLVPQANHGGVIPAVIETAVQSALNDGKE